MPEIEPSHKSKLTFTEDGYRAEIYSDLGPPLVMDQVWALELQFETSCGVQRTEVYPCLYHISIQNRVDELLSQGAFPSFRVTSVPRRKEHE